MVEKTEKIVEIGSPCFHCARYWALPVYNCRLVFSTFLDRLSSDNASFRLVWYPDMGVVRSTNFFRKMFSGKNFRALRAKKDDFRPQPVAHLWAVPF